MKAQKQKQKAFIIVTISRNFDFITIIVEIYFKTDMIFFNAYQTQITWVILSFLLKQTKDRLLTIRFSIVHLKMSRTSFLQN